MFDDFLNKFKQPINLKEVDKKNKKWILQKVNEIIEKGNGVIFVSRLKVENLSNGTSKNTIFHDAYYGNNFSPYDYIDCANKYEEMAAEKVRNFKEIIKD